MFWRTQAASGFQRNRTAVQIEAALAGWGFLRTDDEQRQALLLVDGQLRSGGGGLPADGGRRQRARPPLVRQPLRRARAAAACSPQPAAHISGKRTGAARFPLSLASPLSACRRHPPALQHQSSLSPLETP